ncbi:hypothetical protein [Nostoc sp. C117]|uniref:hypothetical protein n=1 Tax=Nostoc sp. C117 TaxID=3349875 RepID=UPI00370D0296
MPKQLLPPLTNLAREWYFNKVIFKGIGNGETCTEFRLRSNRATCTERRRSESRFNYRKAVGAASRREVWGENLTPPPHVLTPPTLLMPHPQ